MADIVHGEKVAVADPDLVRPIVSI